MIFWRKIVIFHTKYPNNFAPPSAIGKNMIFWQITGAHPGFQVRGGGAHLKKMRRAEEGANIFGVFRVKNHDFTPKNHIFSNFREEEASGAYLQITST
jgi:hypothetical protein